MQRSLVAVLLPALLGAQSAVASTYEQLGGLAADEGTTVAGPIANCDLACCQRRCDAEPKCHSITLNVRAKACYLKDRCLTEADKASATSTSSYVSYRAAGCHGQQERPQHLKQQHESASVTVPTATATATATAATASTTTTPQITTTAAAATTTTATTATAPGERGAHLTDILEIIHTYCIQELHTDKWSNMAGSNLGSPQVKRDMEDRASTFCSSADWRRSMAAQGYELYNTSRFDALFPASGSDPCSADHLFHYVGSGIGSWVSNIGNIMYAMDAQRKTIGFRDQTPQADGTTQANERYGLLFGYKYPECTAPNAKKTQVMIQVNEAERLKSRSTCDYAAMKHFFSWHMWRTVREGPLGDRLRLAVDRHLDVVRAAAAGAAAAADTGTCGGGGDAGEACAAGSDSSNSKSDGSSSISTAAAPGTVPYIGLHFRHKWEFKLTPPRPADVAELLRSVVTHIDPTAHKELADIAPAAGGAGAGGVGAGGAPGAARYASWGARPVVFCASEDVRSAHVAGVVGCSKSPLAVLGGCKQAMLVVACMLLVAGGCGGADGWLRSRPSSLPPDSRSSSSGLASLVVACSRLALHGALLNVVVVVAADANRTGGDVP
jgi:hypothetical protein